MKRVTIITGVILAGLFSSCQNYVDDLLTAPTKSSLDESVIFASPDLAKGAIDGIKIPFTDTNSYRGRFLPWYGFNTDSEWYNSSQSTTSGDKPDLCIYSTLPGNLQMNTADGNGVPTNFYTSMYSGIERANLAIRGIRTYGHPAAGNQMGYLLGQALALRAIYYNDLLRSFGDVPARFEPITSSTIYIAKSSREVIYKQLIADLGEAENLVPWPNTGDATVSVEQINRAFVKGFRARLALIASGYQQYPDGGSASVGVIRRTTDSDLSVAKMYQLALNECRDVIASNSVHLEPSFKTLWMNSCADNLSSNKEALWEIPFADIRGRMLYTFAGKHAGTNQFQAMGAVGGSFGPLPNVFYDYDQVDTRRDITCISYAYGAAVKGIAQQVAGKLNTWFFGKYRFEWMNPTRIPVSSTNDDGVNKVYMRYAEVLLMAAETANELEGPASAAPYLKAVRSRAFSAADQAAKVDAYISTLTSHDAMFNAIVDEHKFEFTGEMERKQALIRWNLLKVKMDDAIQRMLDLQNRAGSYTDVPVTLYTKYQADNVTLSFYGINRGENDAVPPAGYDPTKPIKWTWTNTAGTTDAVDKAKSLYKLNPETREFWPIWTVYIQSSNGLLHNDYGY